MKELFSPQEVANILDIHVKTVRRYLRDGILKGIKIGGSWKVSKDELEEQVNQTVSESFSNLKNLSMKGNEKIMKSLTVNVKVNNQKEANRYAQALMKIINSNDYSECKFKYEGDGVTAKFLLSGPTDYLLAMMNEIDEIGKELTAL